MKILSEIKMAAMRLLALVAVAAPMMVSCYDDSELQQQIDMLVDKVFALEEQMNAELATLKGLLEGKLFITEVTTDGGTTNVMLSDSTLLKLLPKQDMKSFVSYITLADGTKCWAYVDENGQKQLFLDEQNHPVPVMAETPEVIVKDDETWIVIGGSEYPLSGNSVFSDYEVIADEETGEVLAVTFTFGETMTFTVTVNSGQGFWFVRENGTDEVKFDSYFVNAGQTVRVQVKSKGVEDYVVQMPDGWKYKEVEDKLEGRRYFDITAPSAEALAAGASSEGNLKVLAVLNGGKASAARLYLTTNPFALIIGVVHFGISDLIAAGTQSRRGGVLHQLQLSRIFHAHVEQTILQHALDAVLGTQHLGDHAGLQRSVDHAVSAGVDDRGGTTGLADNAGALQFIHGKIPPIA